MMEKVRLLGIISDFMWCELNFCGGKNTNEKQKN